MVPPWFAPPQADWPAQTVQVGFPRGDRFGDAADLDGATRDFLAAGPPPVAVTYGSSMRHGGEVFAPAAKACAGLGRRAVLVTTRPEQIPDALPPGMRHLPYAPFGRLLPLCSAVVHHGGIGTTAEALAAGLPQLVVPNAFDQFDNAARIVRLKVGARLDRNHVTAARTAAALGPLLGDAAVAASCARIRARMATACDAVEAAAAVPEPARTGS